MSSTSGSSGKSVKFADEAAAGPKKAWQDSLNTSPKALSFLLSTGMLSDITFAVGPEGKQFRVHRLILATRSPVFEELLVSDPRYSSCDDVIPIRDDPVAGFQWLMQHIYCDKAEIDSMEIALQVLALGEKYMVASAYSSCIRFLRGAVRRSNVLALYRHLITSYSDNQSLYDLCRTIFASNGNAVLLSSALQRLPAKAMSALLREPLAVTSEVVIFKAVVSWGNAQLKANGLPNLPVHLRREVDPFIKEIRFFTMTSEEFVQNVLVADVLTADESVIALKHIARPGSQVTTTDLLNEGIKLCPSREPRMQLITNERTQTCSCDGVARSWLKRDSYEFNMTTSDNIVLLAFKLQLQGPASLMKVDVLKGDDPTTVLGSTETTGSTASFSNPLHLLESVGYTVHVSSGGGSSGGTFRGGGGDGQSGNEGSIMLFGAEHHAATFTEAGITFTLSPGVYVQAIVFV